MKAAMISNVATYNVVNREERNLSPYFSKRLYVKVNFHLIHLLLIFPKWLATLTGCHIKKNKFFLKIENYLLKGNNQTFIENFSLVCVLKEKKNQQLVLSNPCLRTQARLLRDLARHAK